MFLINMSHKGMCVRWICQQHDISTCVLPVHFIERSHVQDELEVLSIHVNWLAITASDGLFYPFCHPARRLHLFWPITIICAKISTEDVSYCYIIVRTVGVIIQIQFLVQYRHSVSIMLLLLSNLGNESLKLAFAYGSHAAVVVY